VIIGSLFEVLNIVMKEVGVFPVMDRVNAPEFLELPESITTLTGNNVTFAVKVFGRPTPKISWKKGKKSVKESKSVSIMQYVDPEDETIAISELQLEKVDPLKNEDIYTVEAANKAGEITHDVQLIGEKSICCKVTLFWYSCV
jgi:hypothetical protein